MNRYQNKYFSVFGDSISTLEGYSQPKEAVFYDMAHKMSARIISPSDTWWGRVIETLGGELLINNSISGSTVCWHPAYQVPSYGCSDERTSALGKNGVQPDVIMVYLGTNDWGAGLPIYNTDKDNLSYFFNAYDKMLEKLKGNYPCAEIWCLTLPISSCLAMENFTFSHSFGGRHICEYSEAIRQCAMRHGCRLIDLEKNEEPVDTMDGCHPNANGMMTMANAIMAELKIEY